MNNNVVVYIIRTFFIMINSIYLIFKINNESIAKKAIVLNLIVSILVCVICGIIYKTSNSFNSVILLIFLLVIFIKVMKKYTFGYSILMVIISLSINYILFFISVIISYFPTSILDIQNTYINLLLIMSIYNLFIYIMSKIRKVKNGIAFLKRNRNDQYFGMITLVIGWIVIFLSIIISSYKEKITGKIGIVLVISSILMFITIQKSLQLYYRQKMLVKDLEETKAELEDKKKEVEELEKENLNFSKVSHSIAHKQKSLEFKLNELSMKSEISSEIGLKDRIEKLGKELAKETISVIGKTGIEEIDDMLKYMQSECVKNKIDFQLQLSGNIYTMINHYINKEELEILLADHIKNAIIAIEYGDNINKSILVRLGKLDGYYGLYIYDSGIEFEIETLYKLGKIPATTHKDNGGTGMGFMNTFDTLRKHKASFVIEEYGKPVKNNFTKALKFIFNQKNEFKIYSYRNEEIEKENKENNLLVEKLNI